MVAADQAGVHSRPLTVAGIGRSFMALALLVVLRPFAAAAIGSLLFSQCSDVGTF